MTTRLPVLLLTRPEVASRDFAAALQAEGPGGFVTVVSPLIGIALRGPLPDMTGVRGVIFTSANGVEAYAALGGTAGLPCFTVGQATADAARDLGFDPRVAGGDAEALVAFVRAAAPEAPVLHLRGAHSRGAVAERLSSAGTETHEAVIYDQPLGDLTAEAQAALAGSVPVVLPLFSPRTAARFAELAAGLKSFRAPLLVAAMSGAVAGALGSVGAERVLVAARPTGREMRKVVAMLMDEARTLEGRGSPQ